jgi:hypothetical protein
MRMSATGLAVPVIMQHAQNYRHCRDSHSEKRQRYPNQDHGHASQNPQQGPGRRTSTTLSPLLSGSLGRTLAKVKDQSNSSRAVARRVKTWTYHPSEDLPTPSSSTSAQRPSRASSSPLLPDNRT